MTSKTHSAPISAPEQSLVERLHITNVDVSVPSQVEALLDEAADRIEALESNRAAQQEVLRRNQERIEALEAQLSKSEPVAMVHKEGEFWNFISRKVNTLPDGTHNLFAAPPVADKDAALGRFIRQEIRSFAPDTPDSKPLYRLDVRIVLEADSEDEFIGAAMAAQKEEGTC